MVRRPTTPQRLTALALALCGAALIGARLWPMVGATPGSTPLMAAKPTPAKSSPNLTPRASEPAPTPTSIGV